MATTLVKAFQDFKEKANFWKHKWISERLAALALFKAESSFLHRAMNDPSV